MSATSCALGLWDQEPEVTSEVAEVDLLAVEVDSADSVAVALVAVALAEVGSRPAAEMKNVKF